MMEPKPENILLCSLDATDDVRGVLSNVASVIKLLDSIDPEAPGGDDHVYGAHLMRQTCIDALEYLQQLPKIPMPGSKGTESARAEPERSVA